jgi:nucleotide-binding universal stress UspA family protein
MEIARARPQKILVPVDFSPATKGAVRYAADLATQHQSRIFLLHVVAGTEGNGSVKAAKQELGRLCQSEGLPRGRCTLLVRAGVPFFEITQSAKENAVDLIIVGRRNPEAPENLGNGLTSERVARYASCPVLLLREAGEIARAA